MSKRYFSRTNHLTNAARLSGRAAYFYMSNKFSTFDSVKATAPSNRNLRTYEEINPQSNMNELFDIPESKSPRLQWMERHNVKVRHEPDIAHPHGDWKAWQGDHDKSLLKTSEWSPGGSHLMEWGDTEMDAICNLCTWNGWKLWNEEQL